MARVQDQEYTLLSDREIAGTGIGTSPAAVSAFSDLQRAVYEDQPADTADVQAGVDAATAAAAGASDAASGAQTSADTAQTRADDAYSLASGKVSKDVGPTWAAPAAALSRAALPAYSGGTAAVVYTQADIQAVIDQVAALTSRLAAVIADGRANHSLTP